MRRFLPLAPGFAGVPRRRLRRRAFSFAEVMFAVVILGIGFIMVAAVFPVAIQQTQNNGEENIAAALARQAANSIASLPTTITNPAYSSTAAANTPASIQTELLFPPTVKNYLQGNDTGYSVAVAPPAIVVPFAGNRWDLVKSNLILPNDARYGYVLFYKRENNSSAAELIVVAEVIRNRSIYGSADTTNSSSGVSVNTLAGDIKALSSTQGALTTTIISPDVLSGLSTALSSATAPQPSAPLVPEGSYVEMPIGIGTPPPSPAGRSYTLGRITNSTLGPSFELLPGDGLELTAGSSGLWGTTKATGSPLIAPATPVTDIPAATSGATIYAPATLQPTVAYAQLYATATAPFGIIKLDVNPSDFAAASPPPPWPGSVANPTGMTSPPIAAAQGAYVIIADDFPFNPEPTGVPSTAAAQDYNIPDNIVPVAPALFPAYSVGALNGHIYRLGTPVAGAPGYFNLDPAYGMRPISIGGTYSPDTVPNPDMCNQLGSPKSTAMAQQSCAKVYIIGVGRTDPTTAGPNAAYSGPAQDIGIFSTYFQVQ